MLLEFIFDYMMPLVLFLAIGTAIIGFISMPFVCLVSFLESRRHKEEDY